MRELVFIGCWLVGDGPINWDDITIKNSTYGIDTSLQEPIISREVDILYDIGEPVIYYLTMTAARWIEYHRISGELVFFYQIIQKSDHDIEMRCQVFKRIE